MTDGIRSGQRRRDHPVDGCICGSAALNRCLIRHAAGNQQANASQTWLGLHGSEDVGFRTLVIGDVAHADAPERLTKGLARLAVSAIWQGRRPGAGLLQDAMRRTLPATDHHDPRRSMIGLLP